jgi:hypothetical protein
MQLTDHFSDYEMGVAETNSRLLINAQFLCRKILEPVREKFGPVRIHDGYRNSEHNSSVGGKSASWHLFEGTHAAADFDCPSASFHEVFDWIRLESGLPFDKVILECNAADQPRCIHVQVDTAARPRRQAFTGYTGDGKDYVQVTVNTGKDRET